MLEHGFYIIELRLIPDRDLAVEWQGPTDDIGCPFLEVRPQGFALRIYVGVESEKFEEITTCDEQLSFNEVLTRASSSSSAKDVMAFEPWVLGQGCSEVWTRFVQPSIWVVYAWVFVSLGVL